jgi:TRAP transporter TAXI family solute receptor
MFRKHFFTTACAVCCGLLFSLAPASSAKAETSIKIATGNLGGVYYPVGVGFGQLIQKVNPGFLSSAMSTGGSVDNVQLLESNEAQIAMIQSNVIEDAYTGQPPFRKKYENLRGITALWPNIVQILTTRDIKTLADLKGKRFVVGAARSGTEVISHAVLDVAGLQYRNKDKSKNDLIPVWLNYTEAVDSLNNKQVDGGIFQALPPDASIAELMTRDDYNIIEMSDEYVDALKSKYPFFARYTVPANSYANQPKELQVVGYPVLLVVMDSVPEETVYTITKTFFENLPDLHVIHKATTLVTLDNAMVGMNIPLHKGAEKYLREKGAIK